MSNGQGGAEQRLVTPGEALGSSSGLRNGTGVINKDGELIATKLGFTKILNNTISISPTHSAYMPQSGDYIIGHVVEVRSNLWFIDIRGPFQGLLPMSLAPWKVEYGESRKHLNIGDALFARVQEVDESQIDAAADEIFNICGQGFGSLAIAARFGVALSQGPQTMADLTGLAIWACNKCQDSMSRDEYLNWRKRTLRILDALTWAGGLCIYEHRLDNGQIVYSLLRKGP